MGFLYSYNCIVHTITEMMACSFASVFHYFLPDPRISIQIRSNISLAVDPKAAIPTEERGSLKDAEINYV